ncbi:Bactericidal permeability-increasing protein, BPI [Glarea lozoyensis ATCC 20868]|uniref:Bactericidal permeability-increasing protein, BPI n=1 Tax=Glarea lozoyensis (strain ATCC 20868 / MF5171) TaxID=1116229 RepID=S3CMH9_GLAL2|nr:Bactericidal permeability-increasing protein, BPI [Glarea lozoyensis ATCC 20868]EPE26930.1 Bactericidal permeability-increasing protein, BPI [Glarea lozoyensis ATCC 20868]
MSTCFGSRKKSHRNGEREPLLPVYEDDTSLQRTAHQKLHSYQQFRAMSKGYMPSTEQIIANLRTFLAADILNPNTPGLTDSGRLLTKYTKQWLQEFIELSGNKNREDQIQDFIWYLLHARVEVDVEDIVKQAGKTRVKADASAVYESLRTISTLLLTNSSFRLFLSDLTTISKQVFADTANTLSTVAAEAAENLEPSSSENKALKSAENGTGKATANGKKSTSNGATPSADDLEENVGQIAEVLKDGLKKTTDEAIISTHDKITDQNAKQTMLKHLKTAVGRLAKRPDYNDSVSTISTLLQRYAKVYSRALDKTVATVQDDVDTNAELDRAVKNGWLLLANFGDKSEWESLEKKFNAVMAHSQKDPEFEKMMEELTGSLQKMLTDPEFFDEPSNAVEAIKEKYEEVGQSTSDSTMKKDVEELLKQIKRTFHSVLNDQDVSKLLSTSFKLWSILNPLNIHSNKELFQDAYTIFIPMLITAIQYLPIPRLEISAPEVDLLLENVIIEPGKTVNNSSFLPFRLKVETYNDLTIHKRKFRTVSSVASLVTVKVQGLSVRADEIGYWMRAHKGLIRLADEGIASFELDDRGIDIEMDIEVGKDRLEKVLSLRNVRVKIHHLSYKLRRSKFTLFGWLFKPFLRPIIRKVLERQLATAIEDFVHAANREVLFARERLRATRISEPKDIMTFIRAVMTRLKPAEDPDLYASVGVTGTSDVRGSVFAGRYAPGSLVKLWEEGARRAGEVVEENATGVGGWRNEIFDVPTASPIL